MASIPPITRAQSGVTAFVGGALDGPFDDPVTLTDPDEFVRCFGPVTNERPLGHAVTQFFRNGGRRAVVVRVPNRAVHPEAPIQPTDLAAPILEADNLGLWALRRSGDFDLLCVPPLGPGFDIDPLIRVAALGVAVEHRAMLLLDPPDLWGRLDEIELDDLFPSGVDIAPLASFVAVYWPYVIAPDSANDDLPGLFAPTASVAGRLAHIDEEAGPWAPLAGETATLQALGVEPSLDASQVGLVERLGVNPVVRAPDGRVVVAAEHTLDTGDLRHLAARRTALLIERSILDGTAWVGERRNDPQLWDDLTVTISRFMADLHRAGAFGGSVEDQAFNVACSGATTTAGETAQQVVVADVGFASTGPAGDTMVRIRIPARNVDD